MSAGWKWCCCEKLSNRVEEVIESMNLQSSGLHSFKGEEEQHGYLHISVPGAPISLIRSEYSISCRSVLWMAKMFSLARAVSLKSSVNLEINV